MSKNRSSSTGLIVAVVFFFFCALAFLFPYTGDDWAWGTSIGLARLQSHFHDYNGRYLGNLLVLLLTRSKALVIVTMAAAYTLTCWLCYKFTSEKRPIVFLFAVLLFLLMPKSIWAQAVVWTSGFSNYVPPALASVSFILLFHNNLSSKLAPPRKNM